MKLLKQPNRWSCLVSSFSMVLDISVETACHMIGHDGSEIIYPEKPEPMCRRAHHIQECVDLCFDSDHACILIDPSPLYSVCENDEGVPVFKEDQKRERIDKYLEHYDSVLCGTLQNGKRHAVAWYAERQHIYDPNGNIYDPIDSGLIIELICVVLPIDFSKKKSKDYEYY